MVASPDRDWNGGVRELQPGEMLDEVVYCTVCGTVFVPHHPGRDCPACALAELAEAAVDGDVW